MKTLPDIRSERSYQIGVREESQDQGIRKLMSNIIIYRNDVDWKQEQHAAKKYFACFSSRLYAERNDLIIARFSALPFYKEQYDDYNLIGAKMINSYDQHQYIADLGNWYFDLQDVSPYTWYNLYDLPEEGPFIIKGETNSKKYAWETHMFAKNKKEAIEIYGLLNKDSLLQYQKLYIRKYIPLEKLDVGLQGLPISREYRFFVYKDKILSGGFYWSSHTEDIINKGVIINPSEVPESFLQNVIYKIRNTEICTPPDFYVIDVAKTESGDWIVIELNDGQMSGLSDNDPEILYKNLSLYINT
jgi:hypothetical protein